LSENMSSPKTWAREKEGSKRNLRPNA